MLMHDFYTVFHESSIIYFCAEKENIQCIELFLSSPRLESMTKIYIWSPNSGCTFLNFECTNCLHPVREKAFP